MSTTQEVKRHAIQRRKQAWRPMKLFATMPRGEVIIDMVKHRDILLVTCESGRGYTVSPKGRVRRIRVTV